MTKLILFLAARHLRLEAQLPGRILPLAVSSDCCHHVLSGLLYYLADSVSR
jgi:hypothetical protein